MPPASPLKKTQPTRERALVKHVKQGDLLTVALAKTGKEKSVHVYGIKTPSVAQQIVGRYTHDEPYAWPAREFIRQMVIGKVVELEMVNSSSAASSRSGWNERISARVFVDGQDISLSLIEKGLAIVDPKLRQDIASVGTLLQAEDKARRSKTGMFSDNIDLGTVRSIKWEKGGIDFIPGWVELNRGKILNAIVETVENGHSLVCYFCDDQLVTRVLLAGIHCDSSEAELRLETKNSDSYIEALAKESKDFVEIRLLCRQVPVRIEGHDQYGNVYGSLLHPRGNIAEILLEEGLGDLNDKTCECLDEEYVTRLRNARKKAQENRKKRWAGFSPTVSKVAAPPAERVIADQVVSQKHFKCRIVEIVSGDALVIVPVDQQDKVVLPGDYLSKARRVYLASIRAPRGKSKNRDAEPWYAEATEIIRGHIGKICNVTLEYCQDQINSEQVAVASDDVGRLHFVTLVPPSSEISINCQLVQEGLARVVKHRASQDRSSEYDRLITAEKSAIDNKLRMFGDRAPPRRLINDLTGRENSSKAKAMETSFKREKMLDGIVEHVVNGSRYKIFIPTQFVLLSFVLSGISAPQTGRLLPGGEISEAEPFAAESQAWAVLNVLYRKVTVQILSVDRGGSFVGILYRQDKKSIQTLLVRAGYARTNHRSGFGCPIMDELAEAEEEAAKAQRGMWVLPELCQEYHQSDTTAASPVGMSEPEGASACSPTYSGVKLAHLNNAASFYVGTSTSKDENGYIHQQVHRLGLAFEKQIANAPLPYSKTHRPRRNDLVIVLSSQSGIWERAKLTMLPRDPTALAEVFLIDWGSYDRISIEHMFACPTELNLVDHPPLVAHLKLGLVKKPSVFKSTDKLKLLMQQETRDKRFNATVIGTPDPLTGAQPVFLYGLGNSSNPEEPFQVQLVREGQLLIDSRELQRLTHTNPHAVPKSVIDSLKTAEEYAKTNRLEIWYYGDCTSDHDEDY